MRRAHRHRRPIRSVGLAVVVGALCAAGAILPGCRQGDDWVDHQPVIHGGIALIRVRLTAQAVSSVTVGAGAGYELLADGRRVSQSAGPLKSITVTRRGGLWLLNRPVSAKRLVLRSEAGFVRLDRTRYRGELHLVSVDDDHFWAINALDAESYLAGVLAKELYPKWSPATFRAQAIAARSFALYHRATFGRTHEYDLGAGTASQVYGGMDAETDASWRAVRETHGKILAFGSAGRERTFLVQYSACCGGIVNGAGVIRAAHRIEPLMGGQRCDDCRPCPRYRWPPVRIAKTDLYAALVSANPKIRELGGLKTIRVKSRTAYDRMETVDIVGINRKKLTIRAEDLRLAVIRSGAKTDGTLYSMNCRITDRGSAVELRDGRGFGHGVGMCQWGAEGKANRRWSAEKILQFYYPGATVVKAY